MSDTPETDHLENSLGPASEQSHPALWLCARRLERERNEAREKATAAWTENLRLDAENRRLAKPNP
jgi:hypothetical protein